MARQSETTTDIPNTVSTEEHPEPEPHITARNLSYADLRARTDAPPGSSWGLFGPSDERGMANFAGPQQILEASKSVRRGVAFNLDYSLTAFDPPPAAHRVPFTHHFASTHADQRDDYVDGLWLQASSQIDGLRHRRHHEHGFYNGVEEERIGPHDPVLGVDRWAENPVLGRGVLIDLDRHRRAEGRPIDHDAGEGLDVADIDRAAEWQGIELQTGDCLLLRTGWTSWYLALGPERQVEVRQTRRWTGVDSTETTIAWLWDHHLSLFASDTMAGEVMPPSGNPVFGSPHESGMIHQHLIALLGLPIGELWNLEDLAADSYRNGEFTCLMTMSPLYIPGAVGSPANAIAIR